MNCRMFGKVVYLYLKKELSQDQMKEAGLHLSQCSDCKGKVQKIETLLNKTGKYLRFTDDDNQSSQPDFSLIKKANEKDRYFFRPGKLIAAAAALLFMAISLFIITENDKVTENRKKITINNAHTNNLETTPPPIIERDNGAIANNELNQEREYLHRAEQPRITDEFSKSYRRWLNARQNTTEPIIVEVIYPDMEIKTIHFLTNK